jgi:serine/threonine-protein kinase SRPK3
VSSCAYLLINAPVDRYIRANRHVALKILTADCYGGEKDTFEVSILEHIKATDLSNPGASHILGLLDYFRHRGPYGEHVCLIFKAMGPDLAAYRRLFPQLRVPTQTLKQITRHLLLALAYLHQSCKVIHTGKFEDVRVTTVRLNQLTIPRHKTAEYPCGNNKD